MSVAIVTGSGCLYGSDTSVHLAEMGIDIVGTDNDMRREFFRTSASTT